MNPCWRSSEERNRNGCQTAFISFEVIMHSMFKEASMVGAERVDEVREKLGIQII